MISVWNKNSVRHGCERHEDCISNQDHSSLEEAVSSCRGEFDNWASPGSGHVESHIVNAGPSKWVSPRSKPSRGLLPCGFGTVFGPQRMT